LPHLAHRLGLEDLDPVALDHDTEGGQNLVEHDGLRIFRLDALSQLRLRAANSFAQLAALCLEIVQRNEAAWIRARLRLSGECRSEGLLAFENELVQGRDPFSSPRYRATVGARET
jgi:hypothetical protein